MSRIIRPGWALAVPVVAATLLGGCGGGSNSANNTDNGGADASVALSFTRPGNTVDIANYTLAAKYDLPVATSGANLLADEASAITYNKDTDTLFVAGDGGTAIVQVDKTGKLIDSMTLPQDSSKPQGTYFYDTEGLTYVGGGRFVLDEERYRQENLITYQGGTTLDPTTAKTVKLGTTIGNIGIEGVSRDPYSGPDGFVFAKEKSPIGVFQSSLDFADGTASNGSSTTVESTNLFDPTTLGVADLADIYSLSNVLPADAGDYPDLILLSQESGMILQVQRDGTVVGRRDIGVAGQNEGITMDADHVIYTANELGGGTDHPQMWKFTPTTDSSNVGIASNLYLSFSREVEAGSGDIVIQNGKGDTHTIPVTDSSQVRFDGKVMTINPSADLVPASAYTVSFDAGVVKTTDGADLPQLSDMTSDIGFATAGDAIAPILASSNPADNAGDVNGSHVVLTFDEPVKAGSGNIVLHSGASGDDRTISVTDTTQVTFSGDSVDITPSADLKAGTAYYVTVDGGAITDLSGNAFAGISGTDALNFMTAGSASATPLAAGDLLFVGINGSGTDAISFMLMKGVNAGTQIGFTDKDYNSSGSPTWPDNEAGYTWSADKDYPAGTIVTIQTDGPTADKGLVSGTGGGVSKSGETYYAFIGKITDPDTGDITVDHFLAAINIGGSDAGDIPSSVQSAGTYFQFPAANAKYAGSLDESDLTTLASDIKNSANWTTSASGFPIDSGTGSLFATDLRPDDLLFTGINADGTDAIAFVLLKDVSAGTQIGFSDKDYSNGTPHWPDNEAGYTWTADQAYPAGTYVTIQTKGPVVDKGSVVGSGGGVSKNGETYYAFVGSIADPDTGDISVDHFLAAIHSGAAAAGDIPAALTSANTFISFTDPDALYSGTLDTTDPNFVSDVKDTANWSTSPDTGYPLTGGSLFP